MSEDKILCPHCSKEVDLFEMLSAQLRSKRENCEHCFCREIEGSAWYACCKCGDLNIPKGMKNTDLWRE